MYLKDFSHKILLTFIVLFCTIQAKAQYYGSDNTIRNIILAHSLETMQRAYENAESSINQLYSYVVDVLGHEIDTQLRKDMNAELKKLDNLANQLSEYGVTSDINDEINASYRRIHKSIADYNNRIAEQNEQAQDKTMQKAAEPNEWSGTGFALKNNYIVTNFHVIDRARAISIYGVNGDMSVPYNASVAATDRINDLAILRIDDSTFTGFGSIPYSISRSLIDVGEDIWVLGYPLTQALGNEIKLTNGIISSRSGYQGDVSTYQISAPLQPGNSGGPLFNSKGNVVGIVNAGVPGADNVGYAIKTSYLFNLAETYSIDSFIPSTNALASFALKDQVKRVKRFVFLIKCSTNSNSNTSYSPSTSHKKTQKASSAPTIVPVKKDRIIITSKNATIRVGDIVEAILPEGRIDKWEISPSNKSFVAASSNGTFQVFKPGTISIWGYINNSPKLFEIKVEESRTNKKTENSALTKSGGTILVTSKKATIHTGDIVEARLPEGAVEKWEITQSSKGNVVLIHYGEKIQAILPGRSLVWGYVNGAAILFEFNIIP